ncbi:class I SAM-dependent methyltransferase [Corynebacterium qintianiae]|uniref:class I SAM-dependent methyltransferase n=1 Tax=Corynebacterium qintianiae TaxID=2709392 RepID=UPI00197E85F7
MSRQHSSSIFIRVYRTRRLATLRRSVQLLRSFTYEQFRPGIFYTGLARDTAMLIDALSRDLTGSPLAGKNVLDVGGGPGYFASEFALRGAEYVGLEPSVSEMSAAGLSGYGAVRGDGAALPFADSTFDVVYSSNVAEHIPDWRAMGDEMLRVCAPGGLVVLSYTVWLGPFGGHETGWWQHYVGGEFARRRYARKNGRQPKNVWGVSLFDVSAADGLAWARSTGLDFAAFPRYHPRWAWWVARVPGIREFATSNLVVALRKPAP